MNVSLPQEARDLEQKIRHAFAEVDEPPGPVIVPWYLSREEGEEMNEYFAGKCWHELTRADIQAQEHGLAITVMTPAAWVYFLPAWMIASIDAYNANFLPDFVVQTLAHHVHADSRFAPYIPGREERLTTEQIDAIVDYLHWIDKHYGDDADEGIGDALSHWSDLAKRDNSSSR